MFPATYTPLGILLWISSYSMLNAANAMRVRRSSNTTCLPQVAIPSFSGECVPLCEPVLKARLHCQRSTSCLCDLSPPPLVRNCLQCVVTAMGEYSEFISHYVATSQSQLTAYATACGDSLDVSLKMMNHEGVLVSLASLGVTTPPRATVPSVICMLDTTPSATAPSAYFGPQGVFHQLFPYLSFACAFFLTMMTQFHR